MAADLAIDFCSTYLRHVKGEWAGQPFVLASWQRDFVRALFGWKRPDGTRKYRKALIFVGRKNGKTMLGAAIALYLLFADREPGAEIYSVAADRDQAAIMFDAAKSMVESEPALAKRCEIYRRSIVVPSTASSYHVLSADAPTKHGKNAHGVLFDELHAQPNRELYDVMKTSQGARRQPLFLMFTTAGYDRKSVCFEEYEYACKVRDGIIVDDTYLPAIFEMGKDADWT
ncbi:MAG TPA: terminase large subunit, partial [Opitutaceae bacterium]